MEGFGYTLASNPTLNSFESINTSQSLKTRFVPVFSIAGIFYENCNFQILYGSNNSVSQSNVEENVETLRCNNFSYVLAHHLMRIETKKEKQSVASPSRNVLLCYAVELEVYIC